MALTKTELYNLVVFLNKSKSVCQKMMRDTRYPELQVIYSKILENLNHVPINFKPGSNLSSDGLSVVFGENEKIMQNGVLKSAIRIPKEHLFDSEGRIRLDGGLTLLHEMSHVVLPFSAKLFTARVGLIPHHADELFADLLSARIAKEIGYRKEVVASHLVRRRSYFGGFPIERLAIDGVKGVREGLREGTFKIKPIERPREPTFRTREGKASLFPGLRKNGGMLKGIFGLGPKGPRRIRPM